MFYTIYKITNTLNGKYYIGKHQTKDLNDGYFGSGKVLKHAIKKHGIENFTKEILHVFDTELEMNAKEKELVELNESSYNLCPGGKGGWGYVNANGLNNDSNNKERYERSRKTLIHRLQNEPELLKKYQECRMKATLAGFKKVSEKYPDGSWRNKKHTEETKKKISKSAKGRIPWTKGRSRTPEEKEKIRQGVLARNKEKKEYEKTLPLW
jgi:hypothetical protein